MANKYGKDVLFTIVSEMTSKAMCKSPARLAKTKMLLIHNVAKALEKQVPPHITTSRDISRYNLSRGHLTMSIQFISAHPVLGNVPYRSLFTNIPTDYTVMYM